MVPGQPLPGRTGAHWDTLGFQGKDPVTDFRGMGVCGVATYSSCAACRVLTTGFTNSLCSSTFCRSSLSGFLFSPSLICNKQRRVKVPPTCLLSPCSSFFFLLHSQYIGMLSLSTLTYFVTTSPARVHSILAGSHHPQHGCVESNAYRMRAVYFFYVLLESACFQPTGSSFLQTRMFSVVGILMQLP